MPNREYVIAETRRRQRPTRPTTSARLMSVAVAGAVATALFASIAAAQLATSHTPGVRITLAQPEQTAPEQAQARPAAAGPTPPPTAAAATQVPPTGTAPTPAAPIDVQAASAAGAVDTATILAVPAAAAATATPAPLAAQPARAGERIASYASVPPIEQKHIVTLGETLSSIARAYGLPTDTLVMNNTDVTNRDQLQPGQIVRVPSTDGLLYEVKPGETLGSIAQRFSVPATAIEAQPGNHVTAASFVQPGQLLLLPGAKVAASPPSPVLPAPIAIRTPIPVLPTPTLLTAPATTLPTPRPSAVVAVATVAAGAARSAPAVQSTVKPSITGWIWPITGPITSYFGPSHPLGIDIGLYGRDGAPIGASRSGTVTFSGGDPCCSYGYYVIVDHGNGYSTLYAHLIAPPPVRAGQQVVQGQTVGYAGTTGNSTGTHLHFELRQDGVHLDPLRLLP